MGAAGSALEISKMVFANVALTGAFHYGVKVAESAGDSLKSHEDRVKEGALVAGMAVAATLASDQMPSAATLREMANLTTSPATSPVPASREVNPALQNGAAAIDAVSRNKFVSVVDVNTSGDMITLRDGSLIQEGSYNTRLPYLHTLAKTNSAAFSDLVKKARNPAFLLPDTSANYLMKNGFVNENSELRDDDRLIVRNCVDGTRFVGGILKAVNETREHLQRARANTSLPSTSPDGEKTGDMCLLHQKPAPIPEGFQQTGQQIAALCHGLQAEAARREANHTLTRAEAEEIAREVADERWQQQLTMEAVGDFGRALGALASRVHDPMMRNILNFGGHVITIAHNLQTFDQLSKVAKAGSSLAKGLETGSLVLNVASMICDLISDGPDAQQMIMEQLQAIANQIADLDKEVRDLHEDIRQMEQRLSACIAYFGMLMLNDLQSFRALTTRRLDAIGEAVDRYGQRLVLGQQAQLLQDFQRSLDNAKASIHREAGAVSPEIVQRNGAALMQNWVLSRNGCAHPHLNGLGWYGDPRPDMSADWFCNLLRSPNPDFLVQSPGLGFLAQHAVEHLELAMAADRNVRVWIGDRDGQPVVEERNIGHVNIQELVRPDLFCAAAATCAQLIAQFPECFVDAHDTLPEATIDAKLTRARELADKHLNFLYQLQNSPQLWMKVFNEQITATTGWNNAFLAAAKEYNIFLCASLQCTQPVNLHGPLDAMIPLFQGVAPRTQNALHPKFGNIALHPGGPYSDQYHGQLMPALAVCAEAIGVGVIEVACETKPGPLNEKKELVDEARAAMLFGYGPGGMTEHRKGDKFEITVPKYCPRGELNPGFFLYEYGAFFYYALRIPQQAGPIAFAVADHTISLDRDNGIWRDDFWKRFSAHHIYSSTQVKVTPNESSLTYIRNLTINRIMKLRRDFVNEILSLSGHYPRVVAAFAELEKANRIIKAYAAVAGFSEADQAALDGLCSPDSLKRQLEGYLGGAGIATNYPLGVVDNGPRDRILAAVAQAGTGAPVFRANPWQAMLQQTKALLGMAGEAVRAYNLVHRQEIEGKRIAHVLGIDLAHIKATNSDEMLSLVTAILENNTDDVQSSLGFLSDSGMMRTLLVRFNAEICLTPLHVAAYIGNPSIVATFIQALDVAVAQGEITREIANKIINAQDKRHRTPQMIAAGQGHGAVANLLASFGVDRGKGKGKASEVEMAAAMPSAEPDIDPMTLGMALSRLQQRESSSSAASARDGGGRA